MKERLFLGLGSNLGIREDNLDEAVRRISETRGVTLIKQSSTLETEAVEYTDQPSFLNRVVLCESALEPSELLKLMKKIEVEMGRVPSVPRGPRLIDIDILVYGRRVLDSHDLVLPHPALKKRWFVLSHITELDPELTDPATEKKYSEILNGNP